MAKWCLGKVKGPTVDEKHRLYQQGEEEPGKMVPRVSKLRKKQVVTHRAGRVDDSQDQDLDHLFGYGTVDEMLVFV